MADPEEAEKPPGRRPPDSDPFICVFAKKVTTPVKTIRSNHQTARDGWPDLP